MDDAAWIEMVAPAQADGELAELYGEIVDPQSGQLDHVLQVHSLHPAGLRAHFALYRAVMRPTRSLRLVDRELVAFVTSLQGGCHY